MSNWKLWLLFLLTVGVVLLRIVVSPSGCISPDSTYYLQGASNLSEGNNYLIVFAGKTTYNAIWPIGYPLATVILHKISGFNLFWASKVVNLLCLLACFWAAYRWFGIKAWFACLPFCTGTMVKIASYSWSETLFITLLLIFTMLLHSILSSATPNPNRPDFQSRQSTFIVWLALFVTSFGMFVTRYIGGFTLPLLGGFALYFAVRKHWKTSLYFGLVSFFSLLASMAYLNYNQLQTGTWAGGEIRDPIENESFTRFSMMVTKGLFNEFWVIRDWDFRSGDVVFLIGMVLQLVVMWKVIKAITQLPQQQHFLGRFSLVLVLISLTYAIHLVIARRMSAFMDLDFRYFSPMTIPLWLACTVWFVQPAQNALYQKTKYWVAVLFLASLVDAAIPGSITFEQGMQLFQEKIF